MSERAFGSTRGQRAEPMRVRVNKPVQELGLGFHAGLVSNCPLLGHNNTDSLCIKPVSRSVT